MTLKIKQAVSLLFTTTFVLNIVSTSVAAPTLQNATAVTPTTQQQTTTATEAYDIPTISALSAILIEASTGKVLYDKNMHARMYPASTTKIMTAMVLLEHMNEEELVTVGDEINRVTADSSKAGHRQGETLSVKNLIRGLIIPSGNDTAEVVAVAVARKIKNNNTLPYEECISVFSALMNEKAKLLNCLDTNFTNPHGYHDANHYTTAYDMSLISKEALKNSIIKEIVAEKSFAGRGAENVSETDRGLIVRSYDWTSHNMLITANPFFYDYASGIKTGFTNEAGSCLSAAATRDGVDLIAVEYKSLDPDRWVDAKNLFEYGFNNYQFYDIQKTGDIIESVALSGHNRLNGDTLKVSIHENITEYMSNDSIGMISKTVHYKNDLIAENKEEDTTIRLMAPIEKDAEIGTISYALNGEALREIPIYAASAVEKATILSNIKFFFQNLGSKISEGKTLFIVAGAIAVVVVAVAGLAHFIRGRRKKNRYNKYKLPKGRRFK